MKSITLFILLSVVAVSYCRADAVEAFPTTDSIIVSIGCWNPSVCTYPDLYWNSWGIPTPAVEPDYKYFAAYGETQVIDWHNPPDWFGIFSGPLCKTEAGNALVTPEPATWVLVSLGVLMLAASRLIRR